MDNADRKSLGKINGVSQKLLDAHATPQHVEQAEGPVLNWNLSPEDGSLIAKIRDRAIAYAAQVPQDDFGFDPKQFVMDIACVHLNGCSLKLYALAFWANADDFLHDTLGIGIHIDRRTGKLRNGFTPRYTLHKAY